MAHTLTLHQTSGSASFVCNLCYEQGSGPVYHCPDCSFHLHPSCVATAPISTHFSHPQHPLSLTSLPHDNVCDCCGQRLFRWSYHCQLCDFDMHVHCIRSPRFLVHPLHPHVLTLVTPAEERPNFRCSCCNNPISWMAYRCTACDFYLHAACASLPAAPRTSCQSKHPGHKLVLLDRPAHNLPAFTCRECEQEGTAWVYHCACGLDLHPQCAKISHKVPVGATGPGLDADAKAADIEAAERVLDYVRKRLALPSSYGASSGRRSVHFGSLTT